MTIPADQLPAQQSVLSLLNMCKHSTIKSTTQLLYLNKILLAFDMKTTKFCWLQTSNFPKIFLHHWTPQLGVEGSLATTIELKWCIKCAAKSTESGLSTKLQTSICRFSDGKSLLLALHLKSNAGYMYPTRLI